MLLPRVIPVLLLKGRGLVKGVGFSRHVYVGDPINAVKIFDAKEVDELLILDITATKEKRIPPLELVQKVADQCLMPFGVGGGITSVEDARRILAAGAEKVCLNTAALENPDIVSELASQFGTQSVVVCLDVKRGWIGGTGVYSRCASKRISADPVQAAKLMVAKGAGEIVINDVTRDGTMSGYGLELIAQVASAVDVPVIALGGCGSLQHIRQAFEAGAQAAAAGAYFVFHGPKRAVLITYPGKEELAGVRGE